MLPIEIWLAVYDWARGHALPLVNRQLRESLWGRHVICRPGAAMGTLFASSARGIRSLTVRCVRGGMRRCPGVLERLRRDLAALLPLWAHMTALEELVLDCADTALDDAQLERLCTTLFDARGCAPLRCVAVNLRRTFVQSPGL
jgi:hypothetical protein